jgi:hypothetical protein
VEPSKNSETSGVESANRADSNLSLKDKMLMLDDMALVDDNDMETDPTDNEESLA